MVPYPQAIYVNYRLKSEVSITLVVSYFQPITQHFESRAVQKEPLQSLHTKRNGTTHPSYINYRPDEK